MIAAAVPPEQWKITGVDHPVFEDRTARPSMRPVDDEAVPAVVTSNFLVLFPVDLKIPWLAVGVLVHRRLNLDGRSVPESRVVPARPLEIEATLLGHPFLDGGPEVVRLLRVVHIDVEFDHWAIAPVGLELDRGGVVAVLDVNRNGRTFVGPVVANCHRLLAFDVAVLERYSPSR